MTHQRLLYSLLFETFSNTIMLIDLNFPGEMSLKQMHALKSNRLVLSSPIHFGMVFERIVNEISSFKTLGLQRENSKIRFLVRLTLCRRLPPVMAKYTRCHQKEIIENHLQESSPFNTFNIETLRPYDYQTQSTKRN